MNSTPTRSVWDVCGRPVPAATRDSLVRSADQLLTATWCGVLEMQPRDGLHVLSVVQGADFRWKGTGKFAADELYVWLTEVPVERIGATPTGVTRSRDFRQRERAGRTGSSAAG